MFLRYLDSLIYNVETFGHVFIEFLAEFRKPNVTTVLLEQRNAKLAFQLLNRIREGRLSDKQLFCRPSKMLDLCQLPEIP